MVYFRQNPHQTTNDRNREKNRREVEQKNIMMISVRRHHTLVQSTTVTKKMLYQLPSNKAQRSPETPAEPQKEE